MRSSSRPTSHELVEVAGQQLDGRRAAVSIAQDLQAAAAQHLSRKVQPRSGHVSDLDEPGGGEPQLHVVLAERAEQDLGGASPQVVDDCVDQGGDGRLWCSAS